jgi:hypothetical protein
MVDAGSEDIDRRGPAPLPPPRALRLEALPRNPDHRRETDLRQARVIVLGLALGASLIFVLLWASTVAVISPRAVNGPPPPTLPVVESFRESSLSTPAGPTVTLVLENPGTVSIDGLHAFLVLNQAYEFNFTSVTRASPLGPGQSASSTIIVLGPQIECGLSYSLTMNGTETNGSEFSMAESPTYSS